MCRKSRWTFVIWVWFMFAPYVFFSAIAWMWWSSLLVIIDTRMLWVWIQRKEKEKKKAKQGKVKHKQNNVIYDQNNMHADNKVKTQTILCHSNTSINISIGIMSNFSSRKFQNDYKKHSQGMTSNLFFSIFYSFWDFFKFLKEKKQFLFPRKISHCQCLKHLIIESLLFSKTHCGDDSLQYKNIHLHGGAIRFDQ